MENENEKEWYEIGLDFLNAIVEGFLSWEQIKRGQQPSYGYGTGTGTGTSTGTGTGTGQTFYPDTKSALLLSTGNIILFILVGIIIFLIIKKV